MADRFICPVCGWSFTDDGSRAEQERKIAEGWWWCAQDHERVGVRRACFRKTQPPEATKQVEAPEAVREPSGRALDAGWSADRPLHAEEAIRAAYPIIRSDVIAEVQELLRNSGKTGVYAGSWWADHIDNVLTFPTSEGGQSGG